MATREMSRGDGTINTFIGVQSGLAMGFIGLLGSEEQKHRWLAAMADHMTDRFTLRRRDYADTARRQQE